MKHKKPLRSWLKPKCGKAQRSDLADVYQINHLPAVNGISCQAVGVPYQDSDRLFARVNFLYHLIKNFSARLLCAFAFNKGFRNFNVFPLGKFRQLR
ncbi:MAG TPA: hypothetical protein P5294_04850 [Smithellaceae bacterium]|nr:hypothetical protein [Smithellaceae bacterium]